MSLAVPRIVALTVMVVLSSVFVGSLLRTPGSSYAGRDAIPAASALHSHGSVEPYLAGSGVPPPVVHVPNLAAERASRSGAVAPLFSSSPAPMGVADLGLRNASGTITPYTYATPSVRGVVNLTRAVSIYAEGDGPDAFSIQMNAVATGVTVGAVTSEEYWAQDTATYVPSSHRLTLVDDLWNFTGVDAPVSNSTIFTHAPGGAIAGSTYYYDVGPKVTVAYPFQLTFFLNTTTVSERPAITFGYAVLNASRVLVSAGTFDTIVFNASAAVLPAAAPAFTVSGAAYNPAGLLDDFELVLVGDGAGDTTSFFNASARLALDYFNATRGAYAPVPAAYNAGADTGETSEGLAVEYAAPGVAIVASGGSFVDGLWNVSKAAGGRSFIDHQVPVNAFLFVSPGSTFNASAAAWVPTFPLPSASPPTFVLPNGGPYTFAWMLSGRQENTLTVPAATNSSTLLNETMAINASAGVYTPLFALGNAELAPISQGGNGTPGNPYVLKDRPSGSIDPVFAQLNDFGYPVFPGILLVNTSKWVDVSPPTFAVTYPSWEAPILAAWNLPGSNDLALAFWAASNVTVLGGSPISGWFPAIASQLFDASLLFWNSSNDLVAGASFQDQGASLAIHGGTGTTVWGDTFLASSVPSLGPNATLDAAHETGVVLAASGDLVYNDYFAVPVPALTPTVDPATCLLACVPAAYTDLWNTTHELASVGRIVLGTNLTGSILHTTYQGGNFWSNYGSAADPYAVLPYTDAGAIAHGGDFWPLLPFSLFNVTFTETGLSVSSSWGVDFGGIVVRSSTTSLLVADPNGTYPVSYLAPAGFAAPPPGNVTVQGAALALGVPFAALTTVRFLETGLVASWSWTVAVAAANGSGPNATVSSNVSEADVALENGTYDFTVAAVGYNGTPANGSFVVPTTTTVAISFNLTSVAQFVAVNLTPGTGWNVTITQGSRSMTFASVTFLLNLSLFDFAPGAYVWKINASGWSIAPGSGAGTSGTPLVQYVYFTAIPGTLGGTVNVGGASVSIDGVSVPLTNGAFSKSEVPGIHTIVVVAPGYHTYVTTVVVYPNRTADVSIEMDALPTASGFEGISDAGWALIAALAAVAAVLGIAMVRGRRPRTLRPPAAVPAAPVPPSPSPAAPVPAAPSAAWVEGPGPGPESQLPPRSPWDESDGPPETSPPGRGP